LRRLPEESVHRYAGEGGPPPRRVARGRSGCSRARSLALPGPRDGRHRFLLPRRRRPSQRLQPGVPGTGRCRVVGAAAGEAGRTCEHGVRPTTGGAADKDSDRDKRSKGSTGNQKGLTQELAEEDPGLRART
jgi:hypothetical protein